VLRPLPDSMGARVRVLLILGTGALHSRVSAECSAPAPTSPSSTVVERIDPGTGQVMPPKSVAIDKHKSQKDARHQASAAARLAREEEARRSCAARPGRRSTNCASPRSAKRTFVVDCAGAGPVSHSSVRGRADASQPRRRSRANPRPPFAASRLTASHPQAEGWTGDRRR
jgi:hypothetical protein